MRGQKVPFFDFMIAKEIIEQIVQEYCADKDLSLVKASNNKENNIKIFITREGGSVSIDDCVDVSHFVESRLDRDVEDYSLMVSSAGI